MNCSNALRSAIGSELNASGELTSELGARDGRTTNSIALFVNCVSLAMLLRLSQSALYTNALDVLPVTIRRNEHALDAHL